MTCPVCQTESAGAHYCPECGAPLEGAACKACEASLLAGASYCTQCGQTVQPQPSSLPWYIAGGALVVLVVVLLLPALRPPPAEPGRAPLAAASDGPGEPGRPPPLTGTPREQADRLFNRVMEARAGGDSAEARFFLPMAVAAYERVGELDTDGLYHLSLLQLEAGEANAARALADRILAASPEHLLALGVAGAAARVEGEPAAARAYYTRLMQAYETERSREVPEYRDHAPILPTYLEEARRFLRQ